LVRPRAALQGSAYLPGHDPGQRLQGSAYVYVYNEDNLEYEEIDNANFKYVQWNKIADAMGLVINNK
jgi:hypothetical protein